MKIDKNVIIDTAYEIIKEENADWGLDSSNPKEFANFVYGVASMTDALIKKLKDE